MFKTFMIQSIPPVSIPPGQPGKFFQVLCPGGGTFVHPWAPPPPPPPREFDTCGFKAVKSPGRQVACFIPSRWKISWEKVWISCHSGLSTKDLDKPDKIFKGERKKENFPVLYRATSSIECSKIPKRQIKNTFRIQRTRSKLY